MGASSGRGCLLPCAGGAGSPTLHLKRIERVVLCEDDGGSDLSETDSSGDDSSGSDEGEDEDADADAAAAAGSGPPLPRQHGEAASEEIASSTLLEPMPVVGLKAGPTPLPPPATSSATAASAMAPTTAVAPAILVRAPAVKEQESDLLERCPKGPNCCDELTNAVRLVSLGCYCGPKLSFQKIGRGAETLPFDWIRTKIEGIFHLLRSDFEGFYDFDTQLPVPGSGGMVCYRGKLHSFWHDDPTDPAMHERYNRRIARFKSIDAHAGLVLFVRVAGHTGELQRAPELLQELKSRFGDGARLLMVLNFQQKASGPAVVQGVEGFMLHLLPSKAHTRGSESFGRPYADAVRIALDWAVGRDVGARHYGSVEAAALDVTPDDWGKSGLGGLRAFEEEEAPATHDDVDEDDNLVGSPCSEASPSSAASP